ncbi:GtrA family protein [Candidatus Falkowbacteria bacterium]|nr:GtrA family protein [Candidatus Falkowbacteria bacterium]
MSWLYNLINLIRRYPSLKQFIKFCVVGGGSAVINFSIYYSFTSWLLVWYVHSAILAFVVSAVFNFTSNKLWTFRNKDQGRQVINQLVKYLTVMISGLTLNTAIIYGLTEWAGFHWLMSWVAATAIITFWNFTFNRFWTFKRREEVPSLPLDQF